ncbi:hypothetical protein MRB53_010758 [Persea americana]|uniref:Uncharacterized protein n=1 Tax=Persea americana TaxID=3435 RepID=A0ACC2LSM7_PERAE|nr:hypothetical protein MRB53_010758 [Persea americana]|eukprot:TRINITY_DN91648_c0_g1_i1.p1 TRINITY_DN91648_c0_g1~~TRINITY_DN91648_c0_g1_i1.p1  ORF type:complete len:177 (+),score=36.95 TRINITY_DN91648_c0_g1_i1:223-753(+)
MVSLSLPAAAAPFAAVIGGTSIQGTFPCSCSFRFVGSSAFHIHTTPRARARALSVPPRRLNAQTPQDYPVQEIRIPSHWFLPSNALQESEWLRVALHKWLDDEYIPEPTNIEISKLAARSYYESLLEKQADLGEILLKMARDLESLSFQESFHGAFSSANAAAHLITLRIESHLEK